MSINRLSTKAPHAFQQAAFAKNLLDRIDATGKHAAWELVSFESAHEKLFTSRKAQSTTNSVTKHSKPSTKPCRAFRCVDSVALKAGKSDWSALIEEALTVNQLKCRTQSRKPHFQRKVFDHWIQQANHSALSGWYLLSFGAYTDQGMISQSLCTKYSERQSIEFCVRSGA